MQGMKIYILIEDKENEIRIDGNLETLRGLLYILRAELLDPALVSNGDAITALSIEDPKPEQGGTHVTG